MTKPNEVMIMDLPNAATTTLTYHKDYSVLKDTPILSESASRAQEFTTQTSITYDNKFGDHSIGVLLLAETRERNSNNLGVTGTGLDFIQLDELNQITGFTKEGKEQPAIPSGSSSQTRVAGFVGRLNYNYADKYYLEPGVLPACLEHPALHSSFRHLARTNQQCHHCSFLLIQRFHRLQQHSMC